MSLKNEKRGEDLANFLNLKPDKDGYYHTDWGKTSAEGLYLSVKEFLRNQQSES